MNENSFALAAAIWPKEAFASETEWREYVAKWFPKLEKINKLLDKAKNK